MEHVFQTYFVFHVQPQKLSTLIRMRKVYLVLKNDFIMDIGP